MLYCSDSNNTEVNGISLRSTEVNVIDMFSLTLFYFARMAALTTESSLPWWLRAIWESVEEQWETAWISAWGTHLVHSRDLTRCTACGLASSCLAALRSLLQFFKMLSIVCVDVFFWEFRFNSCDWFHEMHNMSMSMISCAAATSLCKTLVMCSELAHYACLPLLITSMLGSTLYSISQFHALFHLDWTNLYWMHCYFHAVCLYLIHYLGWTILLWNRNSKEMFWYSIVALFSQYAGLKKKRTTHESGVISHQ
jgi:hypothetical protein